MKTLKNNLLPVALLTFVLIGCSPGKIQFSNNDIDAGFFEKVLKAEKLKKRVTSGVAEVHVYNTTFHQVMVEKDNIIEWALVGKNTTKDTVDYLQSFATRIELYLLELKDSNNHPKGFIYYSVKFRKVRNEINGTLQDACFGFGKAYYGFMRKQEIIQFDDELQTVRAQGKYRLEKKTDATYMFIVDYTSDFAINVEKVINTGYNKISGNKDLVYNVEKVFQEKNPMKFKYVKTITIK